MQIFKTPPPEFYWHPDELERKLRTIYRRSYLCVPKRWLIKNDATGHERNLSDALALRGNAVKIKLLGEDILIKRGFEPAGKPELHCFSNLCPHQLYPLLEEDTDESQSNFIQCRYHRLMLGCNGDFKSHPAFPHADADVKNALSLAKYKIYEWHDFFFIARDKPMHYMDTIMQFMRPYTKNLPLTKARYHKTETETRSVAGCPELHGANFVDVFHIKEIHKSPHGLSDALEMDSYKVATYPGLAVIWAYARNPDEGLPPEMTPEDLRHPGKRVYGIWCFKPPDWFFCAYKWGFSVNILHPDLPHPDRTRFYWYHYVWDEEAYSASPIKDLMSLVDLEDTSALKRTYNNLRLGTPDHCGILNPQTEKGPHWYYAWIKKAMR